MKRQFEMVRPMVKMAIAALISLVLLALIMTAIKNPVTGPTRQYSADFADVSGLRENADVRIRGVQVGKVQSIQIVHRGGDTFAEVVFSLQDEHTLPDNAELAVKYQNLTGIRYVDMTVPSDPGPETDHLSIARTHPSFDITQLFNGLQPVLSKLSPSEVNDFTENALALLQGDGDGLAPMLDSLQKLGQYASDRQQLISALVENLSRIADTMGGKSPQVVEFLRDLSVPVDQAMTVLDEFRKTSIYGPQFMAPVDQLLIELGLTPDMDAEALIASAFSSVSDAVATLRLLPATLAGLQDGQLSTSSMNCTNGRATVPPAVDVLLNGSGVVICNLA